MPDQESGWEHLLRALREFWDMLVEKGYAGWLVWFADRIGVA